jgi:hypothetical protein
MTNDFLNIFAIEKPAKCLGMVFRADVYHGKTKKGLMYSVRLNLVKSLSCSGCDSCGGLSDSIDEISRDWPIINIHEAKHGKFYRLIPCNMSTDWETGYVDSWDLKIVEFIND